MKKTSSKMRTEMKSLVQIVSLCGFALFAAVACGESFVAKQGVVGNTSEVTDSPGEANTELATDVAPDLATDPAVETPVEPASEEPVAEPEQQEQEPAPEPEPESEPSTEPKSEKPESAAKSRPSIILEPSPESTQTTASSHVPSIKSATKQRLDQFGTGLSYVIIDGSGGTTVSVLHTSAGEVSKNVVQGDFEYIVTSYCKFKSCSEVALLIDRLDTRDASEVQMAALLMAKGPADPTTGMVNFTVLTERSGTNYASVTDAHSALLKLVETSVRPKARPETRSQTRPKARPETRTQTRPKARPETRSGTQQPAVSNPARRQ